MVEQRKAAMTAGALKRKSDSKKKKGEHDKERRGDSDRKGDYDKEERRERKPSSGAVDKKVNKSPSATRKKVEKQEEFSDDDEVLDL